MGFEERPELSDPHTRSVLPNAGATFREFSTRCNDQLIAAHIVLKIFPGFVGKIAKRDLDFDRFGRVLLKEVFICQIPDVGRVSILIAEKDVQRGQNCGLTNAIGPDQAGIVVKMDRAVFERAKVFNADAFNSHLAESFANIFDRITLFSPDSDCIGMRSNEVISFGFLYSQYFFVREFTSRFALTD